MSYVETWGREGATLLWGMNEPRQMCRPPLIKIMEMQLTGRIAVAGRGFVEGHSRSGGVRVRLPRVERLHGLCS
jgi:hypothetical protein